MRHSAGAIDWTKLSSEARWALDEIMPLVVEGDDLEKIAEELKEPLERVEAAHELLEAETQALAGHIVIRPHTEDEIASLAEAIAAHGQIYEILRASDGVIVDGKGRMKICRSLGLEPKIRDLALPSDQLRALSLALNVARRHLTAGERRGILRAEILLDATRSDRQIAAAAGVSHHTVASVRRELETAGQVGKTPTRVGKDGKAQRVETTRAAATPEYRTVRVRISAADYEDFAGGAVVECEGVQLRELRPGLFELHVYDDASIADLAEPENCAALERVTREVDAMVGFEAGTTLTQILGDASAIFGREITLATLSVDEIAWAERQLAALAAHAVTS